MGGAQGISFDEVRARKQWTTLRQRLHERCDQWLAALAPHLSKPQPPFPAVSQAVWDLRHSLTGSVTEAIRVPASQEVSNQSYACCPQCEHRVKSRGHVHRPRETLVGPVHVSRAYFYCVPCRHGFYPLDATLALAPGHHQFEVQQAAAQLVAEVPYETAHGLCTELTGIPLGPERMPTRTHQRAEGLPVVDGAPARPEMLQAVETLAAPQAQPPVMGLAMDGAQGPPRPETARGRCAERPRQRAKRLRWQGQDRAAQGARCSLLDEERMGHGLSWHQVQTDQEMAAALRQIKEAGLLPAKRVRLCVVADGAPWIWKQGQAVFPHAQQV